MFEFRKSLYATVPGGYSPSVRKEMKRNDFLILVESFLVRLLTLSLRRRRNIRVKNRLLASINKFTQCGLHFFKISEFKHDVYDNGKRQN